MISAIILTKNEELNISECLKSLSWVDEVVLVDSGSTDGTVDIARSFGAQVYINKFVDYSTQRNFAIDRCTQEWIIYLDADERVTDELSAEIIKTIGSAKSRACDGYRMDRLEYFMGGFLRYGGFGRGQHNHHLRLWRRGVLRFSGAVHERIECTGATGRLKGVILHYSNEGLISGYIDKLNKYTTLELNAHRIKLGRVSWYQLYFYPVRNFLMRMFVYGGWRDGHRGFIFFSIHAFYDLISYSKRIEADKCI